MPPTLKHQRQRRARPGTGKQMFEAMFFYILAAGAVLSGLAVVTLRNPINSAIALVASFGFLAGMYALLSAHLVFVLQLVVYAGAIMVLFIFVIMLLNLRDEVHVAWGEAPARSVWGLVLATLLGGGLIVAGGAAVAADWSAGALPPEFGTVQAVGEAMFSGPYILAFESVSILLTIGMVGAVVLAKRRL